jgi:hypothetical protein
MLCVITGLDPVIPIRDPLCPPERDRRVRPGDDEPGIPISIVKQPDAQTRVIAPLHSG